MLLLLSASLLYLFAAVLYIHAYRFLFILPYVLTSHCYTNLSLSDDILGTLIILHYLIIITNKEYKACTEV